MDFSSIIGHKDIITGLTGSIKSDKVGHAYIFNGSKGIGKRTVARIFAHMLLCSSDTSCGTCMPCRMAANGSNPDFYVIDPGSSSISVDEIRSLQGDTVIRPLYSKRKVYLIIDADKMTIQAQNCLLKTLEEPPGYAVIILTTANYGMLAETIHSRCLKYNFKKNTYDEVCEFLETKLGCDLKAGNFIVSYANGVIGTAMELAGSEEFISLREDTIEILLRMAKSRLIDIFGAYDFFEKNKDSIGKVLDIMLLFYRDLLVVKKTDRENMLINSDKKDIILNNVNSFSTQKLMRSIDVIELTRKTLKQNANFQLSIEVMLMKLQEEND